MADYHLEALIRPVHEWGGAVIWWSGALITLLVGEIISPVPVIIYTLVGIASARAIFWTARAIRLSRYHGSLWRSHPFRLKRLPFHTDHLYVGRGVRWRQRHAQRLADIEAESTYEDPPRLYKRVRDLERRFRRSKSPLLAALFALTSSASILNPVRPLVDLGGRPALHAVVLYEPEEDVLLDETMRNGHLLVTGTTRSGKTRLLELLARQDIRRGDTTVIIDPKGDAELLMRVYAEAIACGRADDFYLFHLGIPGASARYNPFGSFYRITEVPTRVAANLPAEGQSLAFREFVWRYVNTIARALTGLGTRASAGEIKRYGEDIEPLAGDYLRNYLERHNHRGGRWREEVEHIAAEIAQRQAKAQHRSRPRAPELLAFREYFKQYEIVDDPVALSLIATIEYEPDYLSRLVGSLLPLMEKLCTGQVGELLSPDYVDVDDPRPIFSWSDIIRSGGIVYIGLDALAEPEVAAVVGSAMFSDLAATCGDIFKSGLSTGLPTQAALRPISVHADEFSQLVGNTFVPMANQAGGAGLRLTCYTQVPISDIEAKTGSRAVTGQIIGNFNSQLFLRVEDEVTASLLTKKLKPVRLQRIMVESTANDSSDTTNSIGFTSSNRQRITTEPGDLVSPKELMDLPKGEAFGLLDGGRLYKIRIPLLEPPPVDAPEALQGVVRHMQSNYHTSPTWHEFRDSTLGAQGLDYPPVAA